LQFASTKKDAGQLKKEFEQRKKIGINIHWLTEKELKEKFGIKKHAALLSETGAEAEAYQITHALLKDCFAMGAEIFDHTEIKNIIHRKKGVELITSENLKINCRSLVIACGYESQRYISKRVQQLNSTYAIVSEPYLNKEPWYKNALIWETRFPYLYLRTTADDRIMIGGKDVAFSDPQKRDALLLQKTKQLEFSFRKLFPHLYFKTDFKWAGTFAATKDSLPYIGSISERPHTFFTLGLGGNGITFSIIAAKMIKELLQGKKKKDHSIFSFNR
jgi:glycine/D-amino acid oxidase-like deaminating enzyme